MTSSFNDNGSIIRDKDNHLFYLKIDNSGNTNIYPLINKSGIQIFISNTNNFFSSINDHQRIINISFKNRTDYYGHPYFIDVSDLNNIIFSEITNHLMNNFVFLHKNLGIFIDDKEIAWFIDDTLKFNKIVPAINFKTINNDLRFLTTTNATLLLSTKPNKPFANINTITWTKSFNKQNSTFINNYLNLQTTNIIDRRNSWITTDPLILKISNKNLTNVTIK